MTTNIDKLHQAGILDKDNMSQDNIDAINNLSDDELNHIEAVHKKSGKDTGLVCDDCDVFRDYYVHVDMQYCSTWYLYRNRYRYWYAMAKWLRHSLAPM